MKQNESLKIVVEKEREVIGLALGGGAARGWAHIGVIQELIRQGVRIDVISGTSAGALVGAVYISGFLDEFAEWVCNLKWDAMIRYGDLGIKEGGIISGKRLLKALDPFIVNSNIEDLPIPFGAVATDLGTGRGVWIRKGPLTEAVRSSISLPGLFSPVHEGENWLVDGGLVDPVPVSLCRALGATKVIAVNLNGEMVRKNLQELQEPDPLDPLQPHADSHLEGFRSMLHKIPGLNHLVETMPNGMVGHNHKTPGMLNVIMGALYIMQDKITRSRMAGDPPEVLLAPRLGNIGLLEFDRAADAIEEGRAVVDRFKPLIMNEINE
ncbi:MAG: patatin-like phospholipase family protein [Deltaproteobacteria bacterium]|nr:patatin-like phospholipase family protein [Deltaproteobacteria bacterium]